MDLKVEGAQRVNNLRVDQAHEAGAAVIATGCPYCHQMLDDSVKLRNLDTQMKVVDIATLLLDSVDGRKPTASQSGR
jgi:Fe-S oxidoreductase